MKPAIFFLATALGLISLCAQTPPPGTISQPPSSANAFTNQATDTSTFTNASGTAYSAGQLTAQLHELRSTLDRTLPVLSAFTQSFSNASGNQSIAGRLEDLLSGSRNRNSGQAPSQSAFHLTNLLTSVEGLLHTNTAPGSSMNPNTIHNLDTLQGQLQAVSTTLESFNVEASYTNAPNVLPGLTPTGR